MVSALGALARLGRSAATFGSAGQGVVWLEQAAPDADLRGVASAVLPVSSCPLPFCPVSTRRLTTHLTFAKMWVAQLRRPCPFIGFLFCRVSRGLCSGLLFCEVSLDEFRERLRRLGLCGRSSPLDPLRLLIVVEPVLELRG